VTKQGNEAATSAHPAHVSLEERVEQLEEQMLELRSALCRCIRGPYWVSSEGCLIHETRIVNGRRRP
jgi:hypothetical protein